MTKYLLPKAIPKLLTVTRGCILFKTMNLNTEIRIHASIYILVMIWNVPTNSR